MMIPTPAHITTAVHILLGAGGLFALAVIAGDLLAALPAIRRIIATVSDHGADHD